METGSRFTPIPIESEELETELFVGARIGDLEARVQQLEARVQQLESGRVPTPSNEIEYNPFQLEQDNQLRIAAELGDETADSDTTGTERVPEQSIPPALLHERTQELDPSGYRNRSHLAQTFRAALDKGIMPFVKLVCKHELACTTLHGAELERRLYDAYFSFISMPDEIANALIDGDLPKKYTIRDSAERTYLDSFWKRAEDARHPGIYMNAITDEEGRSPLVKDLRTALATFKDYCFGESHLTANDVDAQVDPPASYEDSLAGIRKYLRSSDDPNETSPIERRKQAASTFSSYLGKLLDTLDGDDIFHEYLVEFGFSVDIMVRLQQYREHDKSSNYLMCLLHACLLRECPGKYRISQYVVHLCARPNQAALCEIIVTRMGQGYVTSGTGFSHYPAGRGNQSGGREVDEWAQDYEWVVANTPMKQHHQKDVERARKYGDMSDATTPTTEADESLDAIEAAARSIERAAIF